MHVASRLVFSRSQAADILLGVLAPDATLFDSTPPFLLQRTARRAALDVLAQVPPLSPHELGALVYAATGDGDPHVRASAVAMLGRSAPAVLATPVLIACSADREEQVRSAAGLALEALTPDQPVARTSSPPSATAQPFELPFIGH